MAPPLNDCLDFNIATNPRHSIYPENAPGNFYVDHRCIDCGTCYAHAADFFTGAPTHAYVARQPAAEHERRTVLEALHACPVNAIGQREKDPLSGEVLSSFPVRLEDGIYFCGFANEKTYGAASYLVTHPGGNILVDVPRLYPRLLSGIEKLGGVRYIFLTHIDDIAGHEKFAAHFGAERIMHANERMPPGIERIIDGQASISLAENFEVIPTPGHTRGSMCLLYDNRILFSGDHLAGSSRGGLTSFRDACWYSWAEVKRSNEKLLGYDFTRVYPGHGHRFRAEDSVGARQALERTIAEM